MYGELNRNLFEREVKLSVFVWLGDNAILFVTDFWESGKLQPIV